jgi:hypothetical protein
MYVGKAPVRDDGPDFAVTTQAKTKTVVPVTPVTSTTPVSVIPTHIQHGSTVTERPDIYPQQPIDQPNIYPQQPSNGHIAVTDIKAGDLPTPVVNTATGEIVAHASVDVSTGNLTVTPITRNILNIPSNVCSGYYNDFPSETATTTAPGTVTTTTTTPVTADILSTPTPADWKPALYAALALGAAVLLFGSGKKKRKR